MILSVEAIVKDRTSSHTQPWPSTLQHVSHRKVASVIPDATGFGLKDMYDQDSDEGKAALGGIGRFDIMSNALGWDRNTLIPGHMSPFSRLSTPGWLEPIAITRNGFYAIQPSEISGHIYKITQNFPEGEYLLIENRQPIKVRPVR